LGNLSTPKSVQKLRTALHAKAKVEAGYRFYALYDKISREDILAHAYAPVPLQQGRVCAGHSLAGWVISA
jgi:RNA-directed DNA polymerase